MKSVGPVLDGGEFDPNIPREELSKKYPKAKYEVKTNLNDRPRRGTLDNTKSRVVLGWEPKYNLEEGISDYLEYVNKYGFA